MARKDYWNSRRPLGDQEFLKDVLHPELAGLLHVLYPGVFPNLAAYKKPRADLQAILMTGIPAGVVPGFQNYTGPVIADMLRLNLAIPPTTSKPEPARPARWRRGRLPERATLFDDVVTIEVRAVAGVTIPAGRPELHA